MPGAKERHVSFGVFAAQALEEGKVDGFWANAMGAETAVTRGVGKIHVDVRRGDDPDDVRLFTFAGLATTDDFVAREPGEVDAAVRAIVKAQKALRADPGARPRRRRPQVSTSSSSPDRKRRHPRRPFYDPVISETAVRHLNAFAQSIGHLSGPVPYQRVVATRCRPLWTN